VFSIACIAAQAKPLFGTLLLPAETGNSDYLLIKQKTDEVTEADEINAAYSLGLHYERTAEGKPDYPKAIEHYRKAAEKGHTGAQYRLGWIYAFGLGVHAEREEGRKWLEKAVLAGLDDAKMTLAHFEISGGNLEKGVAGLLELEDRLNDEDLSLIFTYLDLRTPPAKGETSETLEAAYEFVKRRAKNGDKWGLEVASIFHCIGVRGHFPYDVDQALALYKKSGKGQSAAEPLDRRTCEEFHKILGGK